MMDSAYQIGTKLLAVIMAGALSTVSFLGGFVLPVVGICLLLLVLGRTINRLLLRTLGWGSVLAVAFLGTPVHELSHVVACWIGRNRVEEFALFKPDRQSGSLGYVRHSYDSQSFYQRVIGNSLVSVAPFFGGALVIFLLTSQFFPAFLPKGGKNVLFTADTLQSLGGLTLYLESMGRELTRFAQTLLHEASWRRPGFWFYLFAMLSVGAHLSPSRSDFEGFFRPAMVLLAAVFLVHLVLAATGQSGSVFLAFVFPWLVKLNALLVLALFFVLLGLAVVGLLWAVWSMLGLPPLGESR